MNTIEINKSIMELNFRKEKLNNEVSDIQAQINFLASLRESQRMTDDEQSGQTLFNQMFGDLWLMRIAFTVLVVILGANLMIDLLDSSMVKLIQERNESIQRSIDSMWLLLVTSKLSL